jgi:hypothetical protein
MGFGADLGGLSIGAPQEMEIMGGGGGGNPMLGGIIQGAMQGGGQALASGAGSGSPTDRRNDLRSTLATFLATSPFKNAEATADHDMRKYFAKQGGFGPQEGGGGVIGQDAFNALGSTNPNILGVNRGVEDFAGEDNVLGVEFEKKNSILKKILGAAIMGGSAIAAPFTGGASLMGTGVGANMMK